MKKVINGKTSLTQNMNLPQEIQDNLITYLEIARIALTTDVYLDLGGVRELPWLFIANQLDLSDEEMNRLSKNLQTYLNQ